MTEEYRPSDEELERRRRKAIDFQKWKEDNLHRHGQKGYFTLAELPQRKPLEQESFGTGWWALDDLIRWYYGQFVVLTGISGHGKSTFIMNVICQLAKQHGLGSFLFVPENEGHLRRKMQWIWGDADGFEDFSRTKCFVQCSAKSPEDQPQSLPWVLEKALIAIDRDKIKLVLIDPWNELDRAKPRDMLMTDYIGECLMLIKQFCRSENVIVVLVAHPTKGVVGEKGKMRPPVLADIEGSMNWYNKCDNGLIVYRDMEVATCRLISAKVREIGAGRIGHCEFLVDGQTGVFTPQEYFDGEPMRYGEHRG